MDLKAIRKDLIKKDYDIGFSDVPDWINTGNSALNNIISGDMRNGIPVGRSTIFSGLNGTGKSFLTANIAKNAQDKGYFVVYFDSEGALGEDFLPKIGVSMDEDKILPLPVGTIEETIDKISIILKKLNKEDKVLFLLDSLSNLQLQLYEEKFESGNVANDQGRQVRIYKQMVSNLNSKLVGTNWCFVCTTHSYVKGTDQRGNPILQPSCGEATLFIPSVVVDLNKSQLRDGKDITGIKIRAKTRKTRFTQVGLQCQIELSWKESMDFLDGAIDVLEAAGIVERNGAWFSYPDENGEEKKFQRKNFHEHAEYLMDLYGSDEVHEKDEADANTEMVKAREPNDKPKIHVDMS